MAKAKGGKSRLGNLERVRKALTRDVGATGSIYHDADMSFVRGVRIPSLALSYLMGANAFRDSCMLLIDGKPASSKSSLALEILNWTRAYAGTGAYIDAENKTAADIGRGTLDVVHLYHPHHRIRFSSTNVLETVQREVSEQVRQCRETNEGLERNMHMPFFCVIDPLAGAVCEENIKRTKKDGGATSRASSGRTEALLWTQWSKTHNEEIANIPFTTIVVNHVKERSRQAGPITITEQGNPGGVVQNFMATVHLRCTRISSKSYVPDNPVLASYDTIRLKCIKNSRGPEQRWIEVRKYAQPDASGKTTFWWAWGRATSEVLARYSATSEIGQVCNVVKTSNEKFSCKHFNMKDVDPEEIGAAIHADETLMEELYSAFCVNRVQEYDRITDEEYTQLVDEATAEKARMDKARDSE